MSAAPARKENPPATASSPLDTCPLSRPEQTRNLVLFGVNTALIYLGSPVIYVGVVQAALFRDLKAPDTVANLPASMYLVMAAMPLLVGWCYPYVSYLKKILIFGFTLTGLMGAVVVATLVLPAPNWLRILAVILHSAAIGAALTVAVTFMWEVLGRGVAEGRRGAALALAFGAGPILAALANLAAQVPLTGAMTGLRFLWNYAFLYATTVPILLLAAFLSSRFVIPLPEQEPVRQPFVSGVFGGLGDFLGNRVLRITAVAAILVYAATQIISNMTLYTEYALDQAPSQSAGYQNALRFTFKSAAGLYLGWLLMRTNPKVCMLVTAGFAVATVVWALTASGMWFLLGFGLVGIAELFGVYGPNYILSASSKTQMRRNMALSTLLLVPASPAAAIFGGIVDLFRSFGEEYRALGFRASFVLAGFLGGVAFLLAVLLLPARPRREQPPGGPPGGEPDTPIQSLT